MTTREYCYQQAEYWTWKALRGFPLEACADPISGKPWKWMAGSIRREMGVEANKALARYWLRKLRETR